MQEQKMIKIRFDKTISEMDNRQFKKTIEDMFQPVNPIFALSDKYTWKPQMDIYENPSDIIILVELAGVNKDDLQLEVNHKALKISGQRKGMMCRGNLKYHLAEIQYGYFERILYLPSPIDSESVEAKFNNGFLQIRLIKSKLNHIHTIPIDAA
ncbi:HSP20 family protein [Candidatus Magnetomoraceae bacterium gMMP-15]